MTAQPKERPILFSGEMVRAILAGRKTQTRRAILPKTKRDRAVLEWLEQAGFDPAFVADPENGWSPYGYPGDRLRVKEAIRHIGNGMSEYIADGAPTVADAWPWKNKSLPGMYCPLGLSRIKLEIVSVRIERLQSITGEDARAEGVRYPVTEEGCPPGQCKPLWALDEKLWERGTALGVLPKSKGEKPERDVTHDDMSRLYFAKLWDEINSKRAGCGWDDNPWLWVIGFKRIAQGQA